MENTAMSKKNQKPTVIEYLPEREPIGNSDVSGCYPLEQQEKFHFDLANIQRCGTMESQGHYFYNLLMMPGAYVVCYAQFEPEKIVHSVQQRKV